MAEHIQPAYDVRICVKFIYLYYVVCWGCFLLLDIDELVLVVAGLMHDVGVVAQRAGIHDRHQKLSEELVEKFLLNVVDVSSVRDLVFRHHEIVRYGLLGFLVRTHDVAGIEHSVELYEDGLVDYKPLYRLLRSPMADTKKGVYYGLRSIDFERDLKAIKPVVEKMCTEDEYKNLLNELREGLERLKQIYSRTRNGLAYVITLAELLRKHLFFCSLVPHIETEPTNSLYEHSRMVAALSVCLKRSASGFTVIYGDVGGIQRFVYGQRVYKGALKSLRGRSLYITMLSDAIAKHLLLTLDLPHVNLIYSSGGNFMLVSELLDDERKRALVQEVNNFLLKRHKGLLRVSLGFADVSLEDGGERSIISNAIAEALRNARIGKERVFFGLLKDNYGLFFEPKKAPSEMVCDSCGLEIDAKERVQRVQSSMERDEPNLCSNCEGLVRLAMEVASAKYLVEVWMDGGYTLSTRPGDVLNFTADGLRVAYIFVERPEEIRWLRSEAGVKLVWVKRLNNTDFLSEAEEFMKGLGELGLSFGFSTMPTHTPLDEKGDIMSFDDLAKRSEGQRMVGFLKLDLDRVGQLVEKHSEKVSGLATVSQLLSFIMEGAVNVVAESYPNVYLIYSGGDDMLAVGSWSDVVEFAEKLSVELEKLVGGGLSFTAAITVEEPKAPVKVVMDSLASYLLSAKYVKDCISVGDERLRWENFRNAVHFAKKWSDDVKNRKISRSLIFEVAGLYQDYKEEEYWTHIRHRLKYVLSRSVERWRESSIPPELDELEKEYLQALSSLFPLMRVVAWLVEGLTREEVAKS
jgi:CRISPR-associated protein Csm1